jgi:DNA-binding NarL/FixJ family response regulator
MPTTQSCCYARWDFSMADSARLVHALQDIKDPLDRAKAAQRTAQILVPELVRIRQQAVLELRASGWSYSMIGKALGFSRQWARVLCEGQP